MRARAWRLPLDGPADAAWNMSVDESLLLCAPGSAPSLRLYQWREPAVSLGFRQAEPEWLARCDALGVQVVRPVTGGGALLHARDLTYAGVAPPDATQLPGDPRGGHQGIRARLVARLPPARPAPSARPAPPGAD